jgi:hypothetical protein
MSEAARNKNLSPWETSAVMSKPLSLTLWKMADKLFDLWVSSDKPKAQKFYKTAEGVLNLPHGRGAYIRIVNKFESGWVPSEDSKWLNFSGG